MPMITGELSQTSGLPQTSEELIKLYGPPGVPNADPVVDLLGRVNGKTYPNDNIPEFLRSAAVQKAKDNLKGNKPEAPIVNPPHAPKVAENATLSISNRRVSLVKDSSLTYPCLCLKVYVEPDPAVSDDEARFARMFARAQCRRAKTPEEADLVVFGGGSDVDPVLYGELPHEMTFPSPRRDERDMKIYSLCLEKGIPMLGICRGAQFLHVMNGGKLYQDVDGHYGDHTMWDLKNKKHLEKVSSVHHQMVKSNYAGGMEVLATASKTTKRWLNAKDCDFGNNADIEAFWYRDTCSIGIQGHPEYERYPFFTKWCLDLLEDLITSNPDLDYAEGGVIRLKPEFIEERDVLRPPKTPMLPMKLEKLTAK